MTDTNTLQALIIAAGMATAGGITFDEPASKYATSGASEPDTSLTRCVVKFGLQSLFSGRKQ